MSERIIYKYPIEPQGRIVMADEQNVVLVGIDPKMDIAHVVVWIEHKTDTEGAQRIQYLVMGTGFTMEDDASYHVGSCITQEGYVWHVYAKELDYP